MLGQLVQVIKENQVLQIVSQTPLLLKGACFRNIISFLFIIFPHYQAVDDPNNTTVQYSSYTTTYYCYGLECRREAFASDSVHKDYYDPHWNTIADNASYQHEPCFPHILWMCSFIFTHSNPPIWHLLSLANSILCSVNCFLQIARESRGT